MNDLAPKKWKPKHEDFNISRMPTPFTLSPFKDIWYGYYKEKDQWVIANSPVMSTNCIAYYSNAYRIDQAILQFRAQMREGRHHRFYSEAGGFLRRDNRYEPKTVLEQPDKVPPVYFMGIDTHRNDISTLVILEKMPNDTVGKVVTTYQHSRKENFERKVKELRELYKIKEENIWK